MAVGRSPFPRARILSVDVSRALELPGVAAVLLGDEVVRRTEPSTVLRPLPGAPKLPYSAMATDIVALRGPAGRLRRRRRPLRRRGCACPGRHRLRAAPARRRHRGRARAGCSGDARGPVIEPARRQSARDGRCRGRVRARRHRRRRPLRDQPGHRTSHGGTRGSSPTTRQGCVLSTFARRLRCHTSIAASSRWLCASRRPTSGSSPPTSAAASG